MITVCFRWDTIQLPSDREWAMYRQLKNAFLVDRFAASPVEPGRPATVEQYATMEEALASCQGQRVFLEPDGTKTLADLPDGDIVIVIGNTERGNSDLAEEGEMYVIGSPHASHLYGVNAAAIALAYNCGQ